ncbi:two-component system response regulator (stage 0 sporulation protein F) [Gracilibacillus halotolerans]|uniref:Two-component system response regulator (Stage 0 sporulation protein F) n=1 Tax=Gracilibacillus halotolerans TaxID=74386 RepID=A0A841RKQ9_9BACI|nr:response regulator [Gracilibacillus halotolerans]MBB6513079.1 two-component system response regulator (stage 0 sporulation protein F) [Gracilibacillus halotolerans]
MKNRVLVVDDQTGIQMLLEEIIKQDGHQVLIANNGLEAFDLIQQTKPDLLITDYRLPIMDGAGLIKKNEELGIYVPTVVMSGLPEKAEIAMGGLQSVVKVISKPFPLEEIRKILTDLLH